MINVTKKEFTYSLHLNSTTANGLATIGDLREFLSIIDTLDVSDNVTFDDCDISLYVRYDQYPTVSSKGNIVLPSVTDEANSVSSELHSELTEFGPITDNLPAVVIWSIIDDILDSINMADNSADKHVYLTVRDYISNHYGD
jgi:hypothetical protein